MCANWNSKKALKSLAQGKYLERHRPDADNSMASAIQADNLGGNAKTSNTIVGDRSKLFNQVPHPQKSRPVQTFFFKANTVDTLGPLNFILSTKGAFQISIPTLIQPTYSNHEDQLCMVTCIENPHISLDHLFEQLKQVIGNQVASWTPIHSHYIEYALPYPGSQNQSDSPYIFCGDWTTFGSIEAAMKSGVMASKKIQSSDHI